MKVKVSDLEPNPYRQMDRYPIDRAKVEMLKAKIGKTMFWDNILARPNGKGKYQIAYGHHRLIALKELEIKTIDIPIKDISDSDMVLIMADENHRMMPNPAILNETILAVKNFLDKEIEKYTNWENAKKVQFLLNLFIAEKNPKATFGQAKGKQGIGETLLHRFLGDDWSKSIVRIGLNIIKTPKEILNRKAVEKMPSIRKAERFAQAVRNYQVPIQQQRKIADEIVEKDTSAEAIGGFVRNRVTKENIMQDDPVTQSLKRMIEEIDVSANKLYRKLFVLRSKMRELDVKVLAGIKVNLAVASLNRLCKEAKKLVERK